MRISPEILIGVAGEHLVCCDLISRGLVAYMSDQGLPYDVIIDTGKKILRVQVKTNWSIRHNGIYSSLLKHGKRSDKKYTLSEFDILAFAALDIRQVGYLSYEECCQRKSLCIHKNIWSYMKDDNVYPNSEKVTGTISFTNIIRDNDWFYGV